MDPVAGSDDIVIEFVARSNGDSPVDVVIDDIVIDDRPANPPAEITADGNFDITVYLNGSVIGRGADRNSGERFQGPVRFDDNVIGLEVDGPGNDVNGILTLRYGSLLVRSGEFGWKSGAIDMFGAIDEGWMNIDFDDAEWNNVAVDGQFPGRVLDGDFLFLDDELGARFMQHSSPEVKQLFRKSFVVADDDEDGIPTPVDLCPNSPTGAEPDRNGNGIGDGCEVCRECASHTNILRGKTVELVSGGVRNMDEVRYGPQRLIDGQARCSGWQTVGASSWPASCGADPTGGRDARLFRTGLQ